MRNSHALCAIPFTLGVTLASAAFAGDFYNLSCRDDQREWLLSLSTTGDERAQFWRDDHPRVRSGSYKQNGDDVTARLEDMTLRLHVAWGDASWVAGDAKGLLQCRYIGDQQLARWQAPTYTLAPPAPTPFVIPGEPLALAPPAPSQPAPGKMCDMQNNCWSGAPPNTHDGAVSPRGETANSLPIHIEGNAAYVEVTLGSVPLTMLLDTGSTNTSITDSVARTLVANGEATLGPEGHVTLADGSTHPSRHIVINRVVVGGHVIKNVLAIVGGEHASLLLGYDVLSAVSGRFTVDASNSRLLFE